MARVPYAYAALHGVVGGGFLLLATMAYRGAGVAGTVIAALLAWFGVSGVLAAVVYFAGAPQALGKRRTTGTYPLWARVIWQPYFAIAAVIVACMLVRTDEAAADEVATGIHVGRIPRQGKVPPGVTLVIDLCAEWAAARPLATAYLAIPTLDRCAPADADATAAIELARQHPKVLVHCALGHGRSATVAVLIALDRGLFVDGDQAIQAFRRVRRGVAPTSAQRALIARRTST